MDSGQPQFNEERQILVDRILADGLLDAHVARSVRREVQVEGVVTAEDAALLFHLEEFKKQSSREWEVFFVEILTEYFVWQNEPEGIITVPASHFLIDNIVRDGKIHTDTQFDLLINVIHSSLHCPDELLILALESVKQTINKSGGGGVLFGPNRQRAGFIDEKDVDHMRKLVVGRGGREGVHVEMPIANLFFDIKELTAGKRNAPEWNGLFSETIATFLMVPPQPYVFPIDDRRAQAQWLQDHQEDGGLKGKTVATFKQLHGTLPVVEDIHEPGEGDEEDGDSLGLSAMLQRAMAARQAVNDAEASWLLKRLSGPELDEPSLALLGFIRERANHIAPALESFMTEHGV